MHSKLVTLVAAVALLLAAGCDSTTPVAVETATPTQAPTTSETEPAAEEAPDNPPANPEPDEPVVAQIGDTLEVTEGADTIGTVTVSKVETSTQPFDEWGETPKHKTFVTFTVKLTANATFDVYEGDFYVLDDGGTRYEVGDGNSFDAADYDDQLGWAELNAGENTSGLLVFDLPAQHATLAYAPNYNGGPIGTWEF